MEPLREAPTPEDLQLVNSILGRFEQITKHLEILSAAIDGLNRLDSLTSQRMDVVSARMDVLSRRVDLLAGS